MSHAVVTARQSVVVVTPMRTGDDIVTVRWDLPDLEAVLPQGVITPTSTIVQGVRGTLYAPKGEPPDEEFTRTTARGWRVSKSSVFIPG